MGFAGLSPQALRLLEIRSLLVTLHELHLADRICTEYGVDAEDMKILAEIEELLKECAPKPGENNG